MRLIAFLLLYTLLPTAGAWAQTIETERQRAYIALTRLGFGPSAGEVDRVAAMGVTAYLNEQLHPERIPVPQTLQAQLDGLQALNTPLPQLLLDAREMKQEAKDSGNKEGLKRLLGEPAREARQARLLREIESPRQLEEALVDFWYNHFNVFSGKELDRVMVGAYERDAIRPFVLGRFRDMLEATATHPAMLYYLDNWKNVAPSDKPRKGKEDGINENYAREVMELHTLGVNGGYTQGDVNELARILSGWGFGRGGKGEGRTAFFFDPDHHDNGIKRFLGEDIRPAGQAEGEHALDVLAYSPATARHLSYLLAQYFVADEPPPSLVARLTDVWLRTRGDLRAVTTSLMNAPEFWDMRQPPKYRTPIQYVVSAVRASGAAVDVEILDHMLDGMGEPIDGCLTPDGYKNTTDAWLSTNGTQARLTFATALGSGKLERLHVERDADGKPAKTVDDAPPQPLDANRIIGTLGGFLSTQTLAAVNDADPKLQAALVLGSPEMMRR